MQRFGHDRLSTWAIGADLDAKQWSSVFRQLVASGLLEADAERHNALRLMPGATAVLKGERTVWMRKDPPKAVRKRGRVSAKTPPVALSPESNDHFNALREWRATVAREQDVPAYVIFHDATLRAIAEMQPRDLDALSTVAGIGSTKLERYGDAVLQRLFDRAAP